MLHVASCHVSKTFFSFSVSRPSLSLFFSLVLLFAILLKQTRVHTHTHKHFHIYMHTQSANKFSQFARSLSLSRSLVLRYVIN